jgi:hypothetical protein
MLTAAFEPMSCALLAGAAEYVCHNSGRHCRAIVPRVRVWLRRNSESVMDTLMQEAAEPLLDATNAALDVRLMAASAFLLLALRALCACLAWYRNR